MRTVWENLRARLGSPQNGPYVRIRWEVADVAMDFVCACQHHALLDGETCHFIGCSVCGRHYLLAERVPLLELTPDEIEAVARMAPDWLPPLVK